MIVFDLECRPAGHRFEGWFSSSGEFDHQRDSGRLTCPICGAAEVGKAIMAPNVGRKGNQLPQPAGSPARPATVQPMISSAPPVPPEALALFHAIAAAQAEAIKSSRWVGDTFADQARAMHYGERDPEVIHGQATPVEARELLEEGVAVAPLLIPIVPPDELN